MSRGVSHGARASGLVSGCALSLPDVDRVFHILSVTLITAGLVVLADVVATLIWEEPSSSLYASIKQHDANGQLDDLEHEFPAPADQRAARRVHGTRRQVNVLANRFSGQVDDGQPIGRIVIPSIGLDIAVIQGTNTSDLQKGPGHYPSTPFPGQSGTTAIAGHRTTYLAPFRNIDSLHGGNVIKLEMPYATLDYRVERTRVVEPTDFRILRRTSYQRLVLTACHPLYSASQRIVAFAKLDRVHPVPLGGAG
jgi:sortase A